MNVINKYLSILNYKEQKKILLLFILMIIAAFMEVVGIGLVIPIITLLTKPEKILTEPTFQVALNYFGNPSETQLIIYMMILFLIIYLVKNLYLALFVWIKFRYIKIFKINLSKKLFSLYLRKPYEFFLLNNSAKILRNTTSESEATINLLFSIVNLMTEFLVFMCVFGLVVYIEPRGAIISVITISLFVSMYYLFIKNKVYRWGKQRQYYQGQNIKNIQQSLGSIKEMKLLGCEDQFIKIFKESFSSIMKYTQYNQTLSQLVKLWLEMLAILGLVLIVIISALQQQASSEILTMLAIFSAAAFRLLPSAGRMTTSIQEFNFYRPSLDLVHEALQHKITTKEKITNHEKFNKDIKLVNVSYSYAETKVKVLKNINLTIKKGDYVGFVGQSGSGKTTLVDLIMGFFETKEGKITIDNKLISENIDSWRKQIGYVPQSIYLVDETLKNNIAFGLQEDLINEENLMKAIKEAQLEEFVSNLPKGLETIVGEGGVRLSGGQKQRIGIARALYGNTEILILDEATSALDIETEKEIMNSIKTLQQKKTVLVISHRLSTVKDCNQIYVIVKGKIIDKGKPEDLLTSKEFYIKK